MGPVAGALQRPAMCVSKPVQREDRASQDTSVPPPRSSPTQAGARSVPGTVRPGASLVRDVPELVLPPTATAGHTLAVGFQVPGDRHSTR